jgi:hypothetical protein
MKKKLRPMGKVTLDLEKILQEMTDPDGHDLQHGEVLHLVLSWLQIHAPHAQETYTADGSHPTLYYGHKDGQK